MKNFNLDDFKIEPHHIMIAHTSNPDYEMDRTILLELNYDRYVLIEGWHCSCYDFDDSEWDVIEYTVDEIKKLANAPYNNNNVFWEQVRVQFCHD